MANSGNSNSGNFANDREKAAKAGQKGGQASSNASSGNFANDRDRASEAGKKGGTESHSGGRH